VLPPLARRFNVSKSIEFSQAKKDAQEAPTRAHGLSIFCILGRDTGDTVRHLKRAKSASGLLWVTVSPFRPGILLSTCIVTAERGVLLLCLYHFPSLPPTPTSSLLALPITVAITIANRRFGTSQYFLDHCVNNTSIAGPSTAGRRLPFLSENWNKVHEHLDPGHIDWVERLTHSFIIIYTPAWFSSFKPQQQDSDLSGLFKADFADSVTNSTRYTAVVFRSPRKGGWHRILGIISIIIIIIIIIIIPVSHY